MALNLGSAFAHGMGGKPTMDASIWTPGGTTVGIVNGSSTWTDDNGWHWEAFGPKGREQGDATSQADALAQAQAARSRVR